MKKQTFLPLAAVVSIGLIAVIFLAVTFGISLPNPLTFGKAGRATATMAQKCSAYNQDLQKYKSAHTSANTLCKASKGTSSQCTRATQMRKAVKQYQSTISNECNAPPTEQAPISLPSGSRAPPPQCAGTAGKLCGCGGVVACDGACSKADCTAGQLCREGTCINCVQNQGQDCNRNECGGTGITQCDGTCSANAPTLPPGFGRLNACGCNSGKVQCDGTCTQPDCPSGQLCYTDPADTASSHCCVKNPGEACGCGGSIRCDGTCTNQECPSGQLCNNGQCIANKAPVISSTPPASVIQGSQYVYDIIASDPDNGPQPLYYRIISGNAGITTCCGKFYLDTASLSPSQYGFTIGVSDGTAETQQSFTITINPACSSNNGNSCNCGTITCAGTCSGSPCSSGQTCQNGQCIQPKSGSCGGCSSDSSCQSGLICYHGRCITPGAQGPGIPSPSDRSFYHQKFSKPLYNAQISVYCSGMAHNVLVTLFYQGQSAGMWSVNCPTTSGLPMTNSFPGPLDQVNNNAGTGSATEAEWSPC